MVGRCIPYWNGHFLGDMLVFSGALLGHFIFTLFWRCKSWAPLGQRLGFLRTLDHYWWKLSAGPWPRVMEGKLSPGFQNMPFFMTSFFFSEFVGPRVQVSEISQNAPLTKKTRQKCMNLAKKKDIEVIVIDVIVTRSCSCNGYMARPWFVSCLIRQLPGRSWKRSDWWIPISMVSDDLEVQKHPNESLSRRP